MQPLLYDLTPLHGAIFTLVAALWAVPEFIGTFIQRSRADSSRRDRFSYLFVMLGAGVGLASAFWSASYLPMLGVSTLRHFTYWLGIALMLAGITLRWTSIVYLGRAFTRDVATRGDQALVQSGPYRLVRHPAYSGVLLTMLGTGIALANWGSLVLILFFSLLGILYRIRVEEKALLEAMGSAYQEYMQRTRRLIPFIW